MRTRLEIFRKGSWVQLLLPTNQKIKYNTVINKIGKISTREISHTNTFSIPKVWQNISALGLNKFNPNTLTTPLNSKFEARYYVEDKLLQEGFVVVNNIPAKVIKLNFIDGGIRLTDQWGSTTFQDLLKNPTIIKPVDYQEAIDDISSYDMTTTPLVQTGNVGTRGHQLISFPNNLNQLGDEFQINSSETRTDDTFIPYHSRPLFNAKALFDLSIESFGYTPIYDDSIDWDIVEDTYLTSKSASEGKEAADASGSAVYPTISETESFLEHRKLEEGSTFFTSWDSNYEGVTAMSFDTGNSIKPIDVPFFTTNSSMYDGFQSGINDVDKDDINIMKNNNSIFVPNTAGGNTGLLTFSFEKDANGMYFPGASTVQAIGYWNHTTPTAGTVEQILTLDSQTFISNHKQEITIDKAFLNTPPANADGFIGIVILVRATRFSSSLNDFYSVRMNRLLNMNSAETFLLENEVVFSEDGSYISATVDMTYAAHQESIKELLVGIMNKEGILMSVNDKLKTVKLFSYGHYEKQKEDGEFYNWSDYLQKHDEIIRDTNYGKKYGRTNQISLSSPYSGNVNRIVLSNQEDSSKYKDFVKNEISAFTDITKVVEVPNTTTPYFEYSLKEKGLVEFVQNLGDLTQINFDQSTQGTLSNLPAFANVNFLTIPRGIGEWYRLIDSALRVQAKFLLPVSVVKTFDISKPVYVEDLGGFYIVEEISEYVDSVTTVTVKLIKLIDDLRNYI